MNYIDTFLNRITMYRLVLYGLTLLTLLTFVFTLVGILELGIVPLLLSLSTLILACGITNHIFARLFNVGPNVESVWITAFILFFTVTPILSGSDAFYVFLAGVFAMMCSQKRLFCKRNKKTVASMRQSTRASAEVE